LTPERWKQIDDLVQAALERAPEDRATFLERACRGDQDLRREVESLLVYDKGYSEFINALPDDVIAEMIAAEPGQSMTGRTLGHYQIVSLLGAGGMGEAYLAEDTLLDRKVAIKLLPPDSVADQQAKRRLIREARAAAKLDHPNICSIYEVAEENGTTFIVMQYIEGETLASKINRKPLELREALDIATQTADALAEAHSHSIIHRDIKPANIMITSRSQVKVMDFGLAKVAAQQDAFDSKAKTDSLLTDPGVIVGTVPYMSPEQVAEKKVDARSDIFSFGALLYEMATGQRAFRGESQMGILAAILNQEPEPLSAKVPHALAEIILRCLRKDPARRYQTMADLKVALEDLREEFASGRQVRARVRRRWAWVALPVLFALLLVAGFFVWQAWRAPRAGEPLQAVALTTLQGVEQSPALSPDGNYVVFTWTGPKQDNQDIYVQMIGQGEPLQRTTDPHNDYNPVWSPDGRWIAFFRSQPPAPTGLRSRELRLMPPLGGPERKLADIRSQDFFPAAAYLAWSADSTSLVVTDSPGEGQPDALFVVSLETGEKRQLTNPQPPVLADISPAVSPDGSSLVFLRRTTWGAGELHLLGLGKGLTAEGEPSRLTPVELRADFPAWMPDGKELIFSAKGSLWRLAVFGEKTPTRIPYIGEDCLMPTISRAQPGKPARLVYVRSFVDTNLWRIETSAPGAPSASAPVRAISSTKHEYHCQFSPDGRRVAFASSRSGEPEIWLSDSDGSNAVQLTSLRAQETMVPNWSPDSQFIAFASNLEGEFEIYIVPAAGGKPRRLTSHPAIDIGPTFSRDGQWIYFISMRSGDYRIWKMPVAGGDAVQLTPNQGAKLFESSDGSNLYYVTSSRESPLWRLPTSGGETLKVLDGVVWFNFWVLDKGIYYIDRLGSETRLQYLSFATGKSTTVARNLGEVTSGLSSSPDGRTILFSRVDSFADDLMLVENFR
jgi:Tol biopolymer transport system component/tRNA A-37 threonylcarbamoyl transferase component Bud32